MRYWILHVTSRAGDSYECAHLMQGISKFVSSADTSPVSRTGRAFKNTLELILASENHCGCAALFVESPDLLILHAPLREPC